MPPYKSDSQRRYFHYAESKGQISPKVVNEFDEASKGMKLPEKVSKPDKFSNLKKKLKGNS
jgi:hypothetical protein